MALFICSHIIFVADYGSLKRGQGRKGDYVKDSEANTGDCYEFLLNPQISQIVWMFSDN